MHRGRRLPQAQAVPNSTQLGAADLGSALERARLRVSLALGARKRYRGCPQSAFPVSLAADRARCRRSSRRRMLSEQVCTHSAIASASLRLETQRTRHKLVSDGYLGRKEGTAIRCVCSSERPEQSILLPTRHYTHTHMHPPARAPHLASPTL